MKDTLIELLETFGYPVYEQGSLTGEYPDSFFTFWNATTDDHHHYDNNPLGFVWRFNVNFYSVSPALVNTMLEQARVLLRQNKFIVGGKGHDLASDVETHTGRGMDALYLESNKED